MVLRSGLLMTIEAPEARYTLECFQMLFALGGVAVAKAGYRDQGPRNRDCALSYANAEFIGTVKNLKRPKIDGTIPSMRRKDVA
jgi:hypothetical protein